MSLLLSGSPRKKLEQTRDQIVYPYFCREKEILVPGFTVDYEADISCMTHQFTVLNYVARLVLAVWCVLLPVLPGPSLAEKPIDPEPSCCCCATTSERVEAVSCCPTEAPVPCQSGNTCSRCPLSSGSLVFLAPDGVSLHRSNHSSWVHLDDFFPQDAIYAPPLRPPQVLLSV
jgi:hypothetical protein